MRTVSAERFVQEPKESVERALTPATLIDYEGTFEVSDIEDGAEETRVSAQMPGVTAEFVAEETDEGWAYEQVGEAGPFEDMRTEAVVETANGGVVVRLTSTVSLGVGPSFLTDRIAAWKRRRELERALEAFADDVE